MDMPNTSKCCIVHQVIRKVREHRNVMLFIDIPDTSKCCIVHQEISRKKGLNQEISRQKKGLRFVLHGHAKYLVSVA